MQLVVDNSSTAIRKRVPKMAELMAKLPFEDLNSPNV
jgi:hypothetical protein